MLLHRLGDGAEDDALLGQTLAEGGLDADGVHHGVHRRARQGQALLQGNAQLVEGLHEFGVDLFAAAVRRTLLRGVGVVGDGLIVNLGQREMAPRGLLLRLPVAEGIQAEVEQPRGLALLPGNQAHDVLREALLENLRIDLRLEAVLVLLLGDLFQKSVFSHSMTSVYFSAT